MGPGGRGRWERVQEKVWEMKFGVCCRGFWAAAQSETASFPGNREPLKAGEQETDMTAWALGAHLVDMNRRAAWKQGLSEARAEVWICI